MRILIYGAGVIGSLYAVLFSNSGVNTTVYARGNRLENLREKGLIYLEKGNRRKADVTIISDLSEDDVYDFIFLTVRKTQLYQALKELKANQSKTIVTMVNSLDDYKKWEQICGVGRILPAFPGAGGRIDGDVLDAMLTPAFIQKTTFAEISGIKSDRTKLLSTLFRNAKIPYEEVRDMYIWQLSHLAMVLPLAQAYYDADMSVDVGRDYNIMYRTSGRIKRNLMFLKKVHGNLSPKKMYLLLFLPSTIVSIALSIIYSTSFANRFMYWHTKNAPDEMRALKEQFYKYVYKIIIVKKHRN